MAMDYSREAFGGNSAPQPRGSPPTHVARPLLVNSVFGNTPAIPSSGLIPRQRPLVRRKLKLNDKASPEKHEQSLDQLLEQQQEQQQRENGSKQTFTVTPVKHAHGASTYKLPSTISSTPLAHLPAELLRQSRSIDASPQLKDAVSKLQRLVGDLHVSQFGGKITQQRHPRSTWLSPVPLPCPFHCNRL